MSATFTSRLTVPVQPERDHIRGPIDAPITVLEYGDFECPFCGAAHPVVQELRRMMGNQMRHVYRHFPLTNIHPHAESAAEAAEAAGAQRRFWAMHDTLFEHQDALESEDLLRYVEDLGADVQRFVREIAEGTYRPRVREDFLSGVRSGVNGTPTFYINGIRHDKPADLQSLLWSIRHARAA